MPDKPATPIFNEVFGDILNPAAPQPEPPPDLASEAHSKLRRNLDLALDRHQELIATPITADTPAGESA